MADLDVAVLAARGAVPEQNLDEWFAAVVEAGGREPDDWDRFAETLAAVAGEKGLPRDAVVLFVENVGRTSDPTGAVAEMVRVGDGLPALYTERAGGGDDDGAAESDPRELSWVADEWRAHFEAGLGDGWSVAVLSVLDESWPQWAEGAVEDRVEFVAAWSEVIRARGAEASPHEADPRSLEWVDAEWRAHFEAGLGDGWSVAVLSVLDESWPQWVEATDEDRRQFVADWAPVILAQETSGPESAAEDDAESAAEDDADDDDEDEDDDEEEASEQVTKADLEVLAAELLADNPELAAIDPQRRQELLDQVLQDLDTTSAS